MFKRTVLIVDDQKFNREILQDILHDEYELLFAEDGRVALEQLEKHKDVISAVILDIVMPEVDGYQVLKVMSKDKDLLRIPVIVSSQKDGEEAEIQALSLGALDFIAKPYKPEIISHRLSNLIRLRETSATINRIQKDQITGLFNKEYFIDSVEDILKEKPEQKYDLIYFGIERFKMINDAYGVKKGDEVLKYIAEILKGTYGTDYIYGRFGNDNFYMWGKHRTYKDEMFEKLFQKVKKCPIDLEIKTHCGIYESIDHNIEVEGMCDRAKIAADMNRGKYNEYYFLYDESIREKMMNEQFILSSIHAAIAEEQFEVYYQPKYDLKTEQMAGAEALVRWIHPEKGFMSPAEFIPVLEQNGLITRLDRYVWEKTCQNIRKWIDKGYTPVPISVNVSRADIYNPKFLSIIQTLIRKYQIPIKYLHLEITESAYTDNPKQIIEVVDKLRKAGFVIEMDDFGTGYSSLNMLAEMPVDVLKIDMRFIQTELKMSTGRGILNCIINLAKWMKLVVVAEGVETKSQVDVLKSMECNYVQGYYFAKPMPVNEFEQKIAEI